MPTIRFFECPSCGHRMRFGSPKCGYCHRPAPFYNRAGFYVVLAVGFVGVTAVSLMP